MRPRQLSGGELGGGGGEGGRRAGRLGLVEVEETGEVLAGALLVLGAGAGAGAGWYWPSLWVVGAGGGAGGGQQGRAAQAGRLAGRRAGSNATLRLEVRVRASCAMIRAPSERRARQRGSLRNTPKAARAGRVGRVVGGLGPVVFQRARRGRDEVPARCFGGRQAAQRASRRRGANGEGDEKERASPCV